MENSPIFISAVVVATQLEVHPRHPSHSLLQVSVVCLWVLLHECPMGGAMRAQPGTEELRRRTQRVQAGACCERVPGWPTLASANLLGE